MGNMDQTLEYRCPVSGDLFRIFHRIGDGWADPRCYGGKRCTVRHEPIDAVLVREVPQVVLDAEELARALASAERAAEGPHRARFWRH